MNIDTQYIRTQIIKQTRNGFRDMGWTNFSFYCDDCGNSKTCRNNMTPFH